MAGTEPLPSTTSQVLGLGRLVQQVRRSRGLTVGELSQRASVSSGLISQLERGRGNPSFLTLSRLAEALEVPLGHFVQGPEATSKVVRAAARKKLVLPEEELVYELLTPSLQGSLEMLRTTVPPGWSNRACPFVHNGEEAVHLLVGRLEVTVGTETWLLDEGDTITYDCSLAHWWFNPTEQSAVIIGAVTPPSF
jgi:transcriptional regulator with XRE-family HTH domain